MSEIDVVSSNFRLMYLAVEKIRYFESWIASY